MSDKIATALGHAESFWKHINKTEPCECDFICSCQSAFNRKLDEIKIAQAELSEITSLKSQLESAQKAGAEMREALRDVLDEYHRMMREVSEIGHSEFNLTVGMIKALNMTISPDCGKDWVHKDELLKVKADAVVMCLREKERAESSEARVKELEKRFTEIAKNMREQAVSLRIGIGFIHKPGQQERDAAAHSQEYWSGVIITPIGKMETKRLRAINSFYDGDWGKLKEITELEKKIAELKAIQASPTPTP